MGTQVDGLLTVNGLKDLYDGCVTTSCFLSTGWTLTSPGGITGFNLVSYNGIPTAAACMQLCVHWGTACLGVEYYGPHGSTHADAFPPARCMLSSASATISESAGTTYNEDFYLRP